MWGFFLPFHSNSLCLTILQGFYVFLLFCQFLSSTFLVIPFSVNVFPVSLAFPFCPIRSSKFSHSWSIWSWGESDHVFTSIFLPFRQLPSFKKCPLTICCLLDSVLLLPPFSSWKFFLYFFSLLMGEKQLSLIIQHLGIADVKAIHSLVSVQEQIPGKFK